jgi:glycine cleavage system T protein (aminomethyltransferase)
MKETPLAASHRQLNARMVPFAGWNMPVQYAEGILAEHAHTRTAVSLFDICHMGEFRIQGAAAETALDAIFARPVIDQPVGVCRYNFLLNDAGGVLDDLIIYRLADDEFFIVVNAGTRESDAARISSLLPQGVTFSDESDAAAKLDLQGPGSAAVLAEAGIETASLPRYFRWIKTSINGSDCLLSRTGYTGELGFELYFDAAKAADMWDYLLSFEQVKPAGLGARDTLRLEMGYALYGHELNTETTPIEAGYGPMLKLDKLPERNFPGSDTLRNNQPTKKLFGIKLEGRRAAREGARVLNQSEEIIGQVTSGAFSPSLGYAIAMAYIKDDLAPGDKVLLDAGRKNLEGIITGLPFYKDGTAND